MELIQLMAKFATNKVAPIDLIFILWCFRWGLNLHFPFHQTCWQPRVHLAAHSPKEPSHSIFTIPRNSFGRTFQFFYFYFLLSHICFPFHQRCWHLRVHLAAPRRGPPLSQLGLSLPHSSLAFPQNSFGRMGVMGAGETVFSLLKVFSSALSLICSLMENKVPFGPNFIISSKSSLLWLLVYHSENTKKQWNDTPSTPSTYSTTVLHPFFTCYYVIRGICILRDNMAIWVLTSGYFWLCIFLPQYHIHCIQYTRSIFHIWIMRSNFD